MIGEKKYILNRLLDETIQLLHHLKVQTLKEEVYFLPIGVLLLKCLNALKGKFNFDVPFDYKEFENLCISSSYKDKHFKEELQEMAYAIEKLNPALEGIFSVLCFSGINYVEAEYLKHIVMTYETFDFNQLDEELDLEKDITGPFIELFLEKLSNDLDSYSFITTNSIKELLVRLFDFNKYKNIADITCGTGGILAESINECRHRGIDPNTITLYGQEINFKITLICKINLLFHGCTNFNIVTKDSLKEPVLYENNYMLNIDIILSNLPLGLKWSIDEIGYRQELTYDILSMMNADWLFIQRGLAALNFDGKAAFIVSKGTLTRKSEKKIREAILKENIIEAVISLPGNLYSYTSMSVEILIINKNKMPSLQNKVFFIDASKDFYKKERGRNDLKPEHIDKIINVYQNLQEIDGYSKVIDSQIIEEHNFELDSALYINDFSTNLKDEKVRKLNEVAEIKRGLQLSKIDIRNSENESKSNTYKYIKISDINRDTIEFTESTEIINNLVESKVSAYKLKPNDILISARGTLIKIAIFEEYMPKSVFSSNILLIRVNPNYYDPYFLKFYLNTSRGKEIISRMQGGATITALNPNKLKEMQIPDLTLEEQKQLVERIKSNEEIYKQRIKEVQNIYAQNLKAIKEEINYKIKY